MSDEAKTPQEEKPELAAVPDDVGQDDGPPFDRVEFWRGVNGAKRTVELEAADTRRYISFVLLTFGILAVVFGFLGLVAKDGGW